MIIMPVPKDIRSFKPKFIGPFTKRQTLAVIPGVILSIILISFGRKYIGIGPAAMIAIIIAAPIFACGFVDIQGMPFWVFARDSIMQTLVLPKHRYYKTDNSYIRYAAQNKITYAYFDGDTEIYSGRKLRKKEKEYRKRLEKYLRAHPEMKPIS